MDRIPTRKTPSPSPPRQLELGSTPPIPTPSDEKPRELKSAPYASRNYEIRLADRGSFMDESDLGITDASKIFCRTFLEKEQTLPQDSLFRDDIFNKTCRKIRNKNEARVLQDITRLIVPSAETSATFNAPHLDCLIESVNEGWNISRPFYGPRPQPDYSVGFKRSTFTHDQLDKLDHFTGELEDGCHSYYTATFEMYFPFLTCEVKCGNMGLDIADRQNAHSMTLAVRGIVELFRSVKREKELHLEILAFSVSHNDRLVRIYGHYPAIDGKNTTFYRHQIHEFSFAALDGKEKWTAYKFTKNVYNIWMPDHLKKICSAIDDWSTDFVQSESGESGPSQGLESHNPAGQSTNDAASALNEAGSSRVDSLDVTPDTLLPQEVSKRPRKRRRNMESISE